MSAKPGPKPNQRRAQVREMFAEWSERNFATYWRASVRLGELREAGAISDEERRQINLLCTRANGSFNVCKFARIAEAREAFYLASLEDSAS